MQNQGGSSTRVTDRGARKKEMILEHALRMASTAGLEGLTIGELAKSVGMSKSGLFAHFGGKEKLQKVVLSAAAERFVDEVLRPAFREPRGEPRVRALFANWLEFLKNSDVPGGSILIAASTAFDERPGEIRDYVQRIQWDLIRNIQKAAKLAVAEGHFRPDLDDETFAWTVYSYVLGHHHFHRLLEDPRAKHHVEIAFETLIKESRIKQD